MPRVKRGTKRRANRKKTLALAQGSSSTRANYTAPLRKRSNVRFVMAISAASTRSAISGLSGSSASTRLAEPPVSHTANSWTA